VDNSSEEAMSRRTLRIIDASLNRIGEGLRFLEEISRLMLNDASLTSELKDMRHEMVRGGWPLNNQLLQARDSEVDVGADLEVFGEEKQRELPAAVVANSRRVQESLRVIEELAKMPGIALDSEKFKHARFALYTIAKTLIFRLARRDKLIGLTGLYFIIDPVFLKGREPAKVAAQAILGGAKVIQLRDKFHSMKEIIPVARQLRDLCAEHGVLFIMNDYLGLALAVEADGLHLGQDDLPVRVARRLLPVDRILGCSVRTLEQAAAAEAEGADYIGVGSIFPTISKEKTDVIGLERLRQIRDSVNLPVVAIGGISRDNAAEVVAAGASSVAVISTVLGAEDVEGAARQISGVLEV